MFVCVCLFFMLADLLPEFRLLGIQQQNVSQVWPLHILAPQNLIIGQEIVGLVMSLFSVCAVVRTQELK